jgi:hypothetical protein
VAVLLKIYAKCIDGQDHISKRRIEDALGDPEDSDPRPADRTGRARLRTWARIGHNQQSQTSVSRRQPENMKTAPRPTFAGKA